MILNEYRSDMRDLIVKAVFAGLLFEILCGMFLFTDELLIIGVILCILVIPGVLTAYVLSNKLIVRITQDDVQFIRFRKPIESIPFENNEFTSYIYTIRLQWVITSKKRYLRVVDLYGQTRNYSCDGLSERNFEKFINEVVSVSKEKQYRLFTEKLKKSLRATSPEVIAVNAGAAYVPLVTTSTMPGVTSVTTAILNPSLGVPEIVEEPFAGGVFYFPKDEVHAVLKKRLKVKVSIIGVIMLLFATMNTETLINHLWFPLILLFVFGGTGFLFWRQYKAQLDATPDYIRITENELLIDDELFMLPDIQLIKMTQEMFISTDMNRFRTLKIIVIGKKKQYLLGHMIIGKNRICYEDYGRLCRVLSGFLKRTGRFVAFDNA